MAFLDETGLAHFWQQILGRLNNFVRAEEGKGLSTNDLTNTLKSNYDAAYTHSTSTHAPTDAEKNAIVGIQKNGTDLSVNSNTRKVNITVPTSASDVGALPTSGGSLTGNLTVGSSSIGTNGYIEGTWLRTTKATESAGNFATISGDGWIYKRTPANVLGDIGGQAKITASGILKGNGAGGVSAAAKGTDYAAPSVGVTATLRASGWATGAKTQAVSVSGVTATTNGSLRIAQSATDEQFAAWGAAQPRVTAQAAGTLTVKATGTVPTIDIPVEVLIV